MKLTLLLLLALSAAQVSIAAPLIDISLICGSDEYNSIVYDITSDYVFEGKIPFIEAYNIALTPWTRGKYEMIEDLLINNNLPPLPPCKDED